MDTEDKNLELASSAAPRSFASAQDDIASAQDDSASAQDKAQDKSPEVMLPDMVPPPVDLLDGSTDATASSVPGEVIAVAIAGEQKKSPTPLQESLRRLRRDKRAMISLIVIVLFILIPIFGPLIYQHIGGP